MTDNGNQHRDKLGLALAGGGFRASLFHIGVLRRMAELDMLRFVEVLSTVSGGSIVGALYILLLKQELDKKARLDKDDYLRIVDKLEQRMCKAIKKNLRVRLFLNPFGTLRFLMTEYSLGRRMSRLYERCVYSETVRELESGIAKCGWTKKPWVPDWFRRWSAPGRINLSDIKMRPGGQPIRDGIETYNRTQVETNGSVITQLILNATSLNSGARFWFSATEIGDWDHGNIRRDEINTILKRKKALAMLAANKAESEIQQKIQDAGKPLYLDLARWWLQADFNSPVAGMEPLFDDFMRPIIVALCTAEPGKLRMAKLPSWYLRKGAQMQPPITGGLSSEQHLHKVATVIAEIAHIVLDKVEHWMLANSKRCQLLLDFIYELYILRMAERVSPNISKDWDKLTLGDAVGASANFPPLFPPLQITGIYDDMLVSRLGLTDGAVFDNIGITGLTDEQCNHIIVSDTGGLLNTMQRSSSGRLGMSARIINILTNREARQTRDQLLERHRVTTGLNREAAFISTLNNQQGGSDESIESQAHHADEQQLSLQYPKNTDDTSDTCQTLLDTVQQRLKTFRSTYALHSLAMFNIDSDEVPTDENAPVSPSELIQVRTDLDAFGDIEMYALMNQGYINADHHIRHYMNPQDSHDHAASSATTNDHPYPYNQNGDWEQDVTSPWLPGLCQNRELTKRTIKQASKRFFRALRMKLVFAWLITLAVLGAIAWYFRDTRISGEAVSQAFNSFSLRETYSVFAYLPSDWSQQSFNLVTLTVAILLIVLLFTNLRAHWFGLVDKLKGKSWFGLSRWGAKLARLPGGYKGNLLWMVWLPLPVAIAMGISAVMYFSHICYRYPLLHKTRLDNKKSR